MESCAFSLGLAYGVGLTGWAVLGTMFVLSFVWRRDELRLEELRAQHDAVMLELTRRMVEGASGGHSEASGGRDAELC